MPKGFYDHYKIKGDKNPSKRTDVRTKISVAHKGKQHFLGKKHTEEWKIKMSERVKGPNHYNWKGGPPRCKDCDKKVHWGSKYCKRCAGKYRRGENNPMWRGGVNPINNRIRQSIEYKLWREAVFKRDNYQCIWGGGEHGNRIQADHIKPFANHPELRFAIDNGRTLCVDCHKKTDTYGWKISNARKL